jgi:hypothetical protein
VAYVPANSSRLRQKRLARVVGAAVAASALALGACGGDDDSPPGGAFSDALAEIGGGGANGSLGVGWADPQLVADSGLGPRLMADALGPNASSLIDSARRLRHEFGFDPMSADRLISIGGSYAFGLRLEGLDGRRLRDALVRAGGETRPADGSDLVEIGRYAVVPDPLLRLDVRGLGAYDALGPDLIVLAISARARSALLGEGDRLIDEPTYRAAADCLGDVVAVRMIPDKLLLSSEVGVDAVAVGVTADSEVMCVIGGSPEHAADVASALERTLAARARDPVSGERISDSVTEVEVATDSYAGVQWVRAEGRPSGAHPRGYFLSTIPLGSLVSLIGGPGSP